MWGAGSLAGLKRHWCKRWKVARLRAARRWDVAQTETRLPGGESFVEDAEFVHYATHQRGEATGYGDRHASILIRGCLEKMV